MNRSLSEKEGRVFSIEKGACAKSRGRVHDAFIEQ